MGQNHNDDGANEAPLTGTLRFVLVMGITFAILWFGMFTLLKGRW